MKLVFGEVIKRDRLFTAMQKVAKDSLMEVPEGDIAAFEKHLAMINGFVKLLDELGYPSYIASLLGLKP